MAKISSASGKRFTFAALGSAFLVQEAFVGPIMVAFYTGYIGLPFEWMTLFFSVITGARLALSFPFGYVADAIGRKRLLLIGQALGILSMNAVFLLRIDRSIALLSCIGVIWGAARAIDGVTFMPSLFYMARKYGVNRDIGEILALRAGIGALLTGLAVITSGFVAARGVQYSFIIDIVIAIIALLFFLAFLDESVATRRPAEFQAPRHSMVMRTLWSRTHHAILMRIIPASIYSGAFLAAQRAAFNYLQPALSLNAVPIEMWGFLSALLFFVSFLASTYYKAADAQRSADRIVDLSCIGLVVAMAGSIVSRSPKFIVIYFLSANLSTPVLVARFTQFVMRRLQSVENLQSTYLAMIAVVQTAIMAAALAASGYLIPAYAYDHAVLIASAITICCANLLRSRCR